MYTLTIALSAFLLFLVQPLISKILLPWFGGGASIWITSLVFFQTMLLAAYGMTHLLVRWLGLRRHVVFTGILLLASLAFLPLGIDLSLSSSLPPTGSLLVVLLLSVGVPYFLLATTSPTLQFWIANDTRATHRNPYVEYGFSNLGSLLGLLAYPFLLEILLTTGQQSWLWSGLYLLYGGLLVATIVSFLRHNRERAAPAAPIDLTLTQGMRLRWVGLAALPSALLLVVTHYLTLDVVNLPLLWVAPLCVYLATFIIAFLAPDLTRPGPFRTVAGVFSILALLVVSHRFHEFAFGFQVFWALACLFIVGLTCHGDLERAKPHKQDLTVFYLMVSAGGAGGSILVGIAAPMLFDTTFEFDLVLVAALYYVVMSQMTLSGLSRWALRGGITAALAMAFLVNETGLVGNTIYQVRTFYSTYAVREVAAELPSRRLVAGTHVHGEQVTVPPFEHQPLAYYHPSTGVGHIFRARDPRRVAVIGVGIGSVVEYGGRGDRFDLYELDAAVLDIATRFFTVLPDSNADLLPIIGDGRVQLRAAPADFYDVMVLDAFTSGSIPTHLLTLEAIEEMLVKLAHDGVIAYHISNQHVDLLPVLAGIAGALDLGIRYHESTGNDRLHMYPATWVLLTTSSETLDAIASTTPGWREPTGPGIVWRDDFSNIWSVLR